MWTLNTREQHSLKALRCQSDLTNAEWAMIAPHLPPVCGGDARVFGRCADYQRHLLRDAR